jgi:hypothetical protein
VISLDEVKAAARFKYAGGHDGPGVYPEERATLLVWAVLAAVVEAINRELLVQSGELTLGKTAVEELNRRGFDIPKGATIDKVQVEVTERPKWGGPEPLPMVAGLYPLPFKQPDALPCGHPAACARHQTPFGNWACRWCEDIVRLTEALKASDKLLATREGELRASEGKGSDRL